MYTLTPLTLTTGQTLELALGAATRSSVGALVLYNESNNLVRVTWGGSSAWLPAWTGDRFTPNADPGYSGAITLTPIAISSAGSAPSAVIAGVAYAPGEPVPGTFPVALVRQINLGNQVPVGAATNLQNDGNPAGTIIVEATVTGGASSTVTMSNSGGLTLAPQNAGATLDALVVTPGSSTADASGSFGDAAHPANWPLHGVADQVPAAGVQAGTLASGVLQTNISSDAGAIASNGAGVLIFKPAASNSAIQLQAKGGSSGVVNLGGGSGAAGAAETGFFVYSLALGDYALRNVTPTSNVMMNRNGTRGANQIFTGTTTPASPNVGDLWIQA